MKKLINYIIINEHNKQYDRSFENETEARHWVINHLDLSENWTIVKKKGII